jgi:hypothetical protein
MNQTTNTLTSGIKTREQLDEEPYGHAVEWIEWDSDFRNSELQHRDVILAVNGKGYLKENRERESQKAIGNYLESTYWAEQGGRNGQTITLTIYRDGQQFLVQGKIYEQQLYLNSDNKQTLGLNGPLRLSNDGFSSAWVGWYEKFVWHASLYLADKRWIRSLIDNRKVLAEHLEWKERIDFLVKKYPGRFAEKLLSDWEAVRKVLEGNTYSDITNETLEYRKIGEQRALLIKEAALKAQKEFIEKAASRMIPAFPTMDPVHGNIAEAAGKIVALPNISFEQFINDLGKSFAVIGSAKDGYYFIHLNSPEMDVFFRTVFYYKSQITPDLPEQYEFIAEVLNEPTMLTYEGKPVKGLMVKVLAGMAGNGHVFIDTTLPVKDGKTTFSGEETLTLFAGPVLIDNATPQQTIEAMIHYIKIGDMNSWRKLFATWQIYSDWDGPPYMDLCYWMPDEAYQNVWETSRRLILNTIYDARVIYTVPVKTIIHANIEKGVPKVEQVKLVVDHVGKFGEHYSSVSNVYVHRKWILQRLDDGPWKVKELQGL